jgi:predicted transcriptional regulator of viral defense system
MNEKATKKAEEVFRKHGGMMATKEAISAGIHPRTLYTMRDEGVLEQVSRGLFHLASLPPLSNPDLVTVSTRIPKGVICLISALAFHHLTVEIPHEVYVALEPGTEEPRVEYPPIRIFWFSGRAYSEGVELHELDGVKVPIYGPAKTIADCFKFRNKIGLDVALDALKSYRNRSDFDLRELLNYARMRKVEKVMTPYLETLL